MTSVPSLMRLLMRSGKALADSAGRMRTRLTPPVSATLQALSLGNMPPETTEAWLKCRNLFEREPAHDSAVGSFDAGDVGKKDKRVGPWWRWRRLKPFRRR